MGFKWEYLCDYGRKQQQNRMQESEGQLRNKMNSIINYEDLYQQERSLRMKIERELELQKIKVKKLLNSHPRTKFCLNCHSQQASRISPPNELKEDNVIENLRDFSHKISTIVFPSTPDHSQPHPLPEEVEKKEMRHITMVENFAVFGIDDVLVKKYGKEGRHGEEFEGQILFSKNVPTDAENQGARLVFPSGMAIKKMTGTKAKEKTIELMSFCYTNLKSFILSLEPPDAGETSKVYHKNEVLEYVNPERKLFCLCIGIHDYTWIDKQKDKYNVSLGIIPEQEALKIGEESYQQGIVSQGGAGSFEYDQKEAARRKEKEESDLQIAITQRVFCIMSYFPFFTFYEQILRNLINNIKMERLAIYKHNEEDIELTMRQTDSRFQLERMKELFAECSADIMARRVQFNRSYELKLINQQKISLMTDWSYAKTYFIDEWIFSVLNMFNFDTFLDLFTLVMLEDRIVFVCENSNILTYTIYLFANILTKPFEYPFPVVNIIPNEEEYLNAPFPVLYGMLKKRKSVQEKKIVEKYDNTYVFLSPEKVEILYSEDRKNLLKRRTSRLNGLRENFKELKKYRRKEPRAAKYEIETTEYCILASTEEKQASVEIVARMNEYISEEIVKKLPSQVQIENTRRKIDQKAIPAKKDENSYLMTLINAEIRKNTKDPFVDRFLETQMVNNLLFQ